MADRSVLRSAVFAVTVSLALAGGVAHAVSFEPLEFQSEEDRQQYRTLVAELRCLVCQNQNLAESDAELAQDLRAEVYRMVKEGATNDDVVGFMVDRYGDFVLYRPPLNAATMLLWGGPFVLAAGGLLLLVTHLRRRARSAPADAPLSAAEREALDRLVGGRSGSES